MNLEKLTDLMVKKVVVEGQVKLTQHRPELETDVVMVDIDGMPVFIKREDLDVRKINTSLVNYVGETLPFYIVDVTEDGRVFGSVKAVKEEKLDALIEHLQSGAEVEGKITKMLDFGAYMEIKGIPALMLNKDFTEDSVSVKEVMKIGDVMKVRLVKATENKRIFVAPVEKYSEPCAMNFDMFEPNQVVLGTVRNVQPDRAYVRIAPGLDALCPIPATGEILEGTKVRFRITQVRKDEGRVRGKIIRIFDNA